MRQLRDLRIEKTETAPVTRLIYDRIKTYTTLIFPTNFTESGRATAMTTTSCPHILPLAASMVGRKTSRLFEKGEANSQKLTPL